MKITVNEHDDYTLASIEGVIDETAHDTFDEQLHPIVASPGRRLLLDLSGTSRLTSVGIGDLVTLVSRANTKGSRVVLVNPSQFVSSILNVTKLAKFFDVEQSVEDGISRLRENE